MVSTGEELAGFQSSVLLPPYCSQPSIQGQHHLRYNKVSTAAWTNSTCVFSLKTTPDLLLYRPIDIRHQSRNRFPTVIRGCVVPEKVPTAPSVDFVEGTEVQPDIGGSGGDSGGGGGGHRNWGGSGGRDGDRDREGASDGSQNKHKKAAMSMSQKLTLGYAALVGLGGAMGYLKSGSQKSLISGVISAALLSYVYTQLPTNPVFASCIGFGLSAALLVVMGSRFKKSGKVFPAGVVSVVSLIMTGGYLHGIMRSFH